MATVLSVQESRAASGLPAKRRILIFAGSTRHADEIVRLFHRHASAGGGRAGAAGGAGCADSTEEESSSGRHVLASTRHIALCAHYKQVDLSQHAMREHA